jgi:hypothetical protein
LYCLYVLFVSVFVSHSCCTGLFFILNIFCCSLYTKYYFSFVSWNSFIIILTTFSWYATVAHSVFCPTLLGRERCGGRFDYLYFVTLVIVCCTDPEARVRFPALPKKKVVGLEQGPLSLVSTTEELLDRKVAAPV